MKNISSEHIKFIVSILLSALMAYAIGIYGNLPWWSFVVTNFIIAIAVNQKPGKSFLSGALGIGLLWLTLALVIDNQNNHILSVKVANILPLKGSYIALIIITSVVGFLLGGLSSLTGSFVRKS
jgi:energy-coupling factor transporter transmembrane protein EcfT